MTKAEAVLASGLERQLGSLPLGVRLIVRLEQPIVDHAGRLSPGPHPVGWVERPVPDSVWIKLLATRAGETARALLEEEILDVVLSRDYPPTVRLT